MRKWEMEYEKYSKSTELDEKIEILQNKIDGKVAFKEEYKEHKRLSAIKENLPKVKNILELRSKLEKENEEMKAEISARQEVSKASKDSQDLEDEMAKLLEEYEALLSEMKKTKSADEKLKIQKQIKENENKRKENNQKYTKAQDTLSEISSKIMKPEMETQQLEDMSCKLSTKISKCNLACNKLMQGNSWRAVDVALEKWDKVRLTAKGEQAKKLEKNKNAARQEEPIKVITEKVERGKQTEAPEKALVEVEEENKSIFSKITGFFKNMVDKAKVRFARNVESEQENEKQQDGTKSNNTMQIENKEDDFRKYLKEIAEKGIDGVEKEAAIQQEKSKENEINKAAERIFEARKSAAEQAKAPFNVEATKQKARKIAEESYNKRNTEKNDEAR